MRRLVVLALVVVAAFLALVEAGTRGFGPIVITPEGEQKLILRFGKVRGLAEPGMSWKIPLLEEVRTFPRLQLYLNAEALPIQTRDEERIRVDNYVIWKIVDPAAFLASFPSGLPAAESQIDKVVRADVRKVIGRSTLMEVLKEKRTEVMKEITEASQKALVDDGIEIVDIRINRTELPPGTEQSVYARMKTERERLARKYRAEGQQKNREIRAEADREATVIKANAGRDAEVIRGQGDAQAARIYAEAHESAPEFYTFVRSLEAYQSSIDDKTTLVLSPEADFFRFLQGMKDPASAQE
ncbi:protease modulator HflC [Myxococcota bacterium]|nr:protease modulator HflC [Myxococcota bacterium]